MVSRAPATTCSRVRSATWPREARHRPPSSPSASSWLAVLSPYQRFATSHNPPPPVSTLPDFYVNFFRSFHFEPSLQWISRYWLHLWFLGYLFAISVLCLPLLVWLRKEGGLRFTSFVVALANIRGGVLLLAAPLFVAQLLLRPLFPAYQDRADVATYTFVFAMGAIFFSDRRFEPTIRREIHWVLLLGVFATIGVAGVFSSVNYNLLGIPRLPATEQAAFALFWTLDVWAWNLAVLYVGIRWLNRPEPDDVLRARVDPALLCHPSPRGADHCIIRGHMEPGRMAEVRRDRGAGLFDHHRSLRGLRAAVAADADHLRARSDAPGGGGAHAGHVASLT
jgi:hypothetical protein